MVVYIVLRNRDMRNATNVFLLNLSVADLLVVLICMPSALAEFYGKDVWYLGPIMCKYHGGWVRVRVRVGGWYSSVCRLPWRSSTGRMCGTSVPSCVSIMEGVGEGDEGGGGG